jgi:KaiC/GvpD/RAD55 family RecA-like ATPase
MNAPVKRHTQGLRLVKYILEEKSWDILTDNEIRDEYFYADSKVCLNFIRKYQTNYSELPPVDLVEQEVNVKFPSQVARQYAINDFIKYKATKEIQRAVLSVKDNAISDPFQCLADLKKNLNQVEVINTTKTFSETAEARFLEYVEDKKKERLGAMPVYPSLQREFGTYEDGTVNAVLGVTGAGKTWYSATQAIFSAYAQGETVLLVSMENPKKSIDARLDALYHKLPFKDLKRHILDMRVQKQWYDDIEKIKAVEKGDIISVDAREVKYTEDILRLQEAVNPTFVIVDGAYKVTTREHGSNYEKSSRTLQELEDAAKQANIPFLLTSQLNKTAMKAKGGRETGFEARFNQEWLLNPSTVLALLQTDDDLIFNRVQAMVCKNRESGGDVNQDPFYINQNKILMDFTEQVEENVDEELMSSIY